MHLCGSRYVDRAEDVTEIKVYSNLPEVSLYKDGQLVETKQGDKVFTFQLPITGKHSIEARSGEHSSVILVNKVDTPNPDYAMDNRKNVTNWFDGELDASCWSVKDNMAAAMADPKAGPILKPFPEARHARAFLHVLVAVAQIKGVAIGLFHRITPWKYPAIHGSAA